MKFPLTVCLIIISFVTCANTQIGRYMTVKNNVSVSQENPLEQTFQITFPASIQTVGDAVRFILINTGYNFLSKDKLSHFTGQLTEQQLPLSLRTLGPTTVEQGLLALAGNAYQLVIDPAHRLVTFRLKPKYQIIYPSNNGDIS